ncbi:hypothetical protein ABI59_23985 [Acidobacteria bacterium Mor1]|nr:hypothetical protein ABI59_23985 [Acidobacteria bacterium Mor1]
MSATRREPTDPSARRLALALAVSVGVHLLLILLFMLIPSSEAADDEPEEKSITFDLTDSTEQAVAPVEEAVDAPVEESVEEIVMAIPSLADGNDPAPTGTPLAIPQPSVPSPELDEEQTPQQSSPEAAPQSPDLAAKEQPDRAGDDPSRDPGTTFNEADDGSYSSGERGGSLDPRREGTPSGFDLGQALQDFDQAVRDGRAREEPIEPPDPDKLDFEIDPSELRSLSNYGVGNLEFSSPDFDWDDYGRQVYVAIWQAWHRRLLLSAEEFNRWGLKNGMFLDHQNRVVFTIERSGLVTGVAVETPAGCFPLDQSAVDALNEVVLPPLPAAFTRDSETVRARFLMGGNIRGMRRALQYLKNQGRF